MKNSTDYMTTLDPKRFENNMNTNNYVLFSLVLCVLKCILSLPIITGNGMILFIIIRHAKKTPSHVSVGFLAFADLSAGLAPWFFLAIYLRGELAQQKVFCTFTAWLEAVTIALDSIAVFIIACERCLLITNWQLHRKWLSVRKQIYVSLFGIFGASVIPTASSLAGDVLPMYENCYWALISEKLVPYILLIPTYTIFSTALICCNLRIVHFVWKHKLMLVPNQNSANKKDFGKEKKTTTIQAFIVSYYILSTLPLMVHSCVVPSDPSRWQVALLDTWLFIWYLTALVNPLIYAYRVPEFQAEYRKICCGLICKRRKKFVVSSHGLINEPFQPRRECTNSQPETDETSLPPVTMTTSVSNVSQNSGTGIQLLEVPKNRAALHLKSRPYILIDDDTKQEISFSGNSPKNNRVTTAGDFNGFLRVDVHRPNVLTYSRYRPQ